MRVFDKHFHSPKVAWQPPAPIWLPPAKFTALTTAGTTAHRICSSPGGWVERLGDDLLVCYKSDADRDELLAGCSLLDARCSLLAGDNREPQATSHKPLLPWNPRRIFTKYIPKQNEDRISPTLHSGDATLPLTTTVTEADTRYGLDFAAGYSHGLFLDQRANRALVRRVKPKRLLNTFAYTCSFSVVAALAGAETVNVDLSKKSLDRGRENFALNGLDSTVGHRFLADDVLDVLPRLARRGEQFDVIILDPPTFSRGNQGRRWQVEQDLEALLESALDLAAPDSRILLSTNCARLNVTSLEQIARFCVKQRSRGCDYLREPELPDFPPTHAASTLWLRLR